MAKIMKQFRLDKKTVETIEKNARLLGIDQTELVSQAIAMSFGEGKSLAMRIDNVYQVINQETEELQALRDYAAEGGGLSDQEEAYLNWLFKKWDEIRALPGFWEARLLENEDGSDYQRDAQGEPMEDMGHARSRPGDM